MQILELDDLVSNPMLLNEYVDEKFVDKVVQTPFNAKPLLAIIAISAIFAIISFAKTQLEVNNLKNDMSTIPMVCTNTTSCREYVKNTLYRITGSTNKEDAYKNYYLIACAYTSINDKYNAVNALNMSLSLNKKYLSAYLLRAHIYMLNRGYAQAILDYKEVLEQSPKATFLNYNIGKAFYKLGKYKEALIYFQRAKNSERKNPMFYEARAFTYVRLGENDLAIKDLERAAKLYSKKATPQGQQRVIELDKMIGKIRAGKAN
jgi:tetratricopeptide (TPR) repeat protein